MDIYSVEYICSEKGVIFITSAADLPVTGDHVVLKDQTYVVKRRTFYPESGRGLMGGRQNVIVTVRKLGDPGAC